MALVSQMRRLRLTPFGTCVEAAGAKADTGLNRMLLPRLSDSHEVDCRHLKEHVQIRDVSCDRQMDVCGPNSGQAQEVETPDGTRRATVLPSFWL